MIVLVIISKRVIATGSEELSLFLTKLFLSKYNKDKFNDANMFCDYESGRLK